MKIKIVTVVLFTLCTSMFLYSSAYANPEGEVTDITSEQYDFNKECNYIIAIYENNQWIAKVNANNINSKWDASDQITYVNFSYGQAFYFDKDNTLIMPFSNSSDYSNGSIVHMLFHNLTKNEYDAIYINFSESGALTFENQFIKDMVLGDKNDKYIMLPDQGSDGGFGDTILHNAEPPTEIILAEPNRTSSAWAKEDIQKALELNFIPDNLQNGYTYLINRADFCEIAFAMLEKSGKITISDNSKVFEDINTVAINSLASAGIISGRSDSIFAPKDILSREDAAVILNRLANYVGIDSLDISKTVTYLDDEDIAAWAKQSVYNIRVLGIMTGMEENIFSPKSGYTKEQSIATLMRLYGMMKK